MIYSNKMTKYDYPTIFFTTLGISCVIFPLLFLFFYQTGDKYLMRDFLYTEDICLPGKNAWHVKHCTFASNNVGDEPRICYYNKDCHVSLTEPKTFPIWFWFLIIIDVFVLIWTSPSPSNMQHWRIKND